MKKKSSNKLLIMLLCCVLVIIGVSALIWWKTSPSQQAKETVETFYNYEQGGEFASSWALFHPQMKSKFTKGHYIQDRAHVFMNHFGVETFTFSIGEVEKLKDWKMTEKSKSLKSVYTMRVEQTFQGKYGEFTIQQPVYVAKKNEEWLLLWNYNYK